MSVHPTLADATASLRASFEADAARETAARRILQALILALFARIFARLEDIIRLWQAGLLPPTAMRALRQPSNRDFVRAAGHAPPQQRSVRGMSPAHPSAASSANTDANPQAGRLVLPVRTLASGAGLPGGRAQCKDVPQAAFTRFSSVGNKNYGENYPVLVGSTSRRAANFQKPRQGDLLKYVFIVTISK